ncbi:multidrug transporter [alpha proteobacterium AAP81b]|nr:multidrug transporter [alpha proteobacterium AAP81b]
MRRAVFLALLPLAACAAPGGDALRQPRAVSSLAAASLSAAPARDWPTGDWWTAYGDPQLDALMTAALAGNPDVAAAGARLRRAEAGIRQARAATLPSLAGNGAVVAQKQSANLGIPPQFIPRGYNDVGRATLDFSWELDFWGKNRAAVAAAVSEARAAGADAAAARLMISTAVASGYADLARLAAERRVAAQAVAVREATLKLVRDRVAAGLDSRAEAEQAAANVPAAREALAAIDEDIGLARNALAALLGDGPDRGVGVALPDGVRLAAFGVPASLAAELIGRKPEIVAARWRVEAAGKRITQARAAFYPNVNLTAFIGYQSLGLVNLVDAGSGVGSVGPALSLPIFDGGRRRADLRGAEADYAAAVAQYDGAVVTALRDVADAATSARALVGRRAEAAAALAAQEEAFRLARLRYEGGLSDYQSVLIAEDAVLQRRRLVASLAARAFSLDIALVRALGGGFVAAPEVVSPTAG